MPFRVTGPRTKDWAQKKRWKPSVEAGSHRLMGELEVGWIYADAEPYLALNFSSDIANRMIASMKATRAGMKVQQKRR